ncbi:hypothetical protein BURMUCGD1_6324 [Burkholderia multivorans CGD1]|nr:hypothetical protein BURMUCGD1_6324 [Burkholderia multivorans CGD1]
MRRTFGERAAGVPHAPQAHRTGLPRAAVARRPACAPPSPDSFPINETDRSISTTQARAAPFR